jgi:hypothetical protein
MRRERSSLILTVRPFSILGLEENGFNEAQKLSKRSVNGESHA